MTERRLRGGKPLSSRNARLHLLSLVLMLKFNILRLFKPLLKALLTVRLLVLTLLLRRWFGQRAHLMLSELRVEGVIACTRT